MTEKKFVGNKSEGSHSTTQLSSAKDIESWQQLKISPTDICNFLDRL